MPRRARTGRPATSPVSRNSKNGRGWGQVPGNNVNPRTRKLFKEGLYVCTTNSEETSSCKEETFPNMECRLRGHLREIPETATPDTEQGSGSRLSGSVKPCEERLPLAKSP